MTFTVTFVFPNAVISTAVPGPDHKVVPRAAALLKKEFGIDTKQAIEVNVYPHEEPHV